MVEKIRLTADYVRERMKTEQDPNIQKMLKHFSSLWKKTEARVKIHQFIRKLVTVSL